MLIGITSVSDESDVLVLYSDRLVFANLVDADCYIQQQAKRGRAPYAMVNVPKVLRRYPIASELKAYRYSPNGRSDDKYVVDAEGVVVAVEYRDARLPLLAQQFWRAIAALYRYAFDPLAGAL